MRAGQRECPRRDVETARARDAETGRPIHEPTRNDAAAVELRYLLSGRQIGEAIDGCDQKGTRQQRVPRRQQGVGARGQSPSTGEIHAVSRLQRESRVRHRVERRNAEPVAR